ncbi:MAG: hypothetical protein MdMp014T_2882 [Treponematales bacterium]
MKRLVVRNQPQTSLRGALAALALLAAVLFLAGCPQTTDDPTYTVWTDSVSYAEFSSQVGTLNDGYYVRAEMTNAQFSQMASSLTDEYRHDWTERVYWPRLRQR